MSPNLLTVDETAERLGLCRASVFRLISEGRLPSVAVTKKSRRIDPRDLESFIAERRSVRAS